MWCVLLSVLLLAAAPLRQPAPPLTLDEALRRAGAGDAGLQQARHAVAAAAVRVREQRVGRLPVITFTTSVSRADDAEQIPVAADDGGLRFVEYGSPNALQLHVDVRQPLYAFGRTRHAVEAARRDEASLAAAGRRAAVDVAVQVKAAYVRAGVYAHLDSLYAAGVAQGEALEAISRRQVASGAALPLETLRAQVALQDLRARRVAAQAEAEKARATLAALMGAETADFRVAGALPALPATLDPALLFDALYARALANRQDLAELDERIRRQRALARAARAQALPTLSLVASGSYRGPKEVFGIDAPGLRTYGLQVGLGLSFDVLAPYAAGLRREALRAERRRLQEGGRAERLAIAAALRQRLADLRAQQALAESSRALLAEARANQALVEAAHRAGTGTLLDLTHARATTIDAEAAVVQARYALAQILLDLEHVVGAELRFAGPGTDEEVVP